jgi:hypothetical protein
VALFKAKYLVNIFQQSGFQVLGFFVGGGFFASISSG